jgi:transcription elongation factor Elf1
VSENKDTPVMFAKEEASQIREMLAESATPLVCPRCNEMLRVSGPVSAGENVGLVYHVVCTPCRRHAAVRDVPVDR